MISKKPDLYSDISVQDIREAIDQLMSLKKFKIPSQEVKIKSISETHYEISGEFGYAIVPKELFDSAMKNKKEGNENNSLH